MVDVSAKPIQRRTAVAEGMILLETTTIDRINTHTVAKGNVLAVARIAAIQAVKRTDELIPLCHSLPLQHVEVHFEQVAPPLNISPNPPQNRSAIQIRCSITTHSQTGVEMEALTGVSIAALTIYDMCKAIDHSMQISGIHLVTKTKN